MRIAIVVLVALAAVGGAAYYASKRLLVDQTPPMPVASWVVHVEWPGANAAKVESSVARVVEEALAKLPRLERMRSRSFAGRVVVELWGVDDAQIFVALKSVLSVLPPDALAPVVVRSGRSETYWLFSGEQRPKVDGEICGRSDPIVHVYLDPLKLQSLQVGALAVDRALKGVAPLEELETLEVAEDVRLSDVARIELAPPPPKCLARTAEGPGWWVRSQQQELGGGGERLEKPMRIEVRLNGEVPEKLTTLQPKVVTVEPQSSTVTLWFSPALQPAARAQVLAELRAVPGLQITHVDAMPRVRLVLSSNERDDLSGIAGVIVETLKFAKGVELVVPPRESVPDIEVKVDRERASMLGVPVEDIAALTELALKGHEHHGVRVTLDLAEREHLGALFLRDRRLSELVTMAQQLEPPELMRENRMPAIEILAYGIGRKGVPMPALPGGVMLEIHEEL